VAGVVTAPYYSGDSVEIHHGDCREVLPALGRTFDAAICDPPYVETSLAWDRWPDGWPAAVVSVTQAMWWEKPRGTGFTTDRFARVHEHALHFYRGPWSGVHHDVPRIGMRGRDVTVQRPGYSGGVHGTSGAAVYEGDGTRLMPSVIRAANMFKRGLHPTEKPVALLTPLIGYAVPPGGWIIDPMAGSCSTAVAARLTGRHAVCIEADEAMCERAARRLDQNVLPMGDAS
jgi:site-specific DNA-methyltransferase (adenine-specific)